MGVNDLDTPPSPLDLALFLLVVVCTFVVCVYHGWASRHYNRAATTADSTAVSAAVATAAALPLRITRKTVLSDLAFLFSVFFGFAFVSGKAKEV